MLEELRQLTKVRFLLFLREPEAVFWVFVFPLVLALVLGIAFKNSGGDALPIGLVDGVESPWREALEAAEDLEIRTFPDRETALRKLKTGAIALLLEGEGVPTARFDLERPDAETAWLRAQNVLQSAAGRVDPVVIPTEQISERGARYIDFLIPGLLGMNLMGTGIWGAGFPIVDMRQKKLLKLLMVTPMRRPIFLFAQMQARVVFLALEVLAITLFGVLVLGVPFRGSIPAFGALCLIGGMAFTGLGLLIASRAKTLEGVSGLMNFVMMPMWLLSGVFFSYERFPEIFHPWIRLLPLTSLNDGLRAIMLEGVGPSQLMVPFLVQLAWGGAAFLVALRIFRWR